MDIKKYKELPFNLDEALRHPDWIFTDMEDKVTMHGKMGNMGHIAVTVDDGYRLHDGLVKMDGTIATVLGFEDKFAPRSLILRQPLEKVKLWIVGYWVNDAVYLCTAKSSPKEAEDFMNSVWKTEEEKQHGKPQITEIEVEV